MANQKLVWVRSDHLPAYDDRKKMVTTALESGLVDVVIRKEDDALAKVGRFDAVVIDGQDLLVDGQKVGELVQIRSSEDQERARSLRDRFEFVLIAANDWKVIPFENIIASYQGSRTKVMAVARTPDEAKLFADTLEVGVDGIAIQVNDPAELKRFADITAGRADDIQLTLVEVTKVELLGVGDRVCIDTCSLLKVGEGMLIGSQSNCLFLIHSESLESEYVAARPFRVNAGPVHSYVLCADGKTKYLSEVRSGDSLMSVDTEGKARSVIVGRAKVEVRPLLLLEVEAQGRKHSIILQNAETIRLCTPEGPVSISDLRKGQRIFVKLEGGGRHFGHAIAETITER
ncbi:MAG TPA: 3-dehydroquinate synthase II [Methanomassiliicoccales archaeon]|nr:3-dehydroquinate synthase II [Methanomassiliicoccales archaeon]